MGTSGNRSDVNKFYKEFGSAPPVQVSLFSQEKGSVCRVQPPPIPPDTVGLQGTADLYELVEGAFIIATNNRMIPIIDADFLVNIVFTFEGRGQIRLSEAEIKFSSTRAVARLLYQGGGQAVAKGGQAKFSKYFSLVENHLKLVLKF